MNLLLKTAALSACVLGVACSSTTDDPGPGNEGGIPAGTGGAGQTGMDGTGGGVVGATGGDGTTGGGNHPLPNGPTTDALETIDAMHWVSYDAGTGNLVWGIQDDGTGNQIVSASVATAHEESSSVSLSIPQAELTDDMARSMGVRFNISGTGSILFQAQSGAVIPTDAGGWCDPDAGACWNAHEETIALTSEYQTIEFFWSDMTQSWGTDTNPVALYPSEILLMSWIILKDTTGEFFLDSIELIPDDGSGPTSGVGTLIDKPTFNAIVSNNNIYTYENFVAAASSFPAFAGDLDETWAKREIAMFLANAKWETGTFQYTVEQNPPGGGAYCDLMRAYGCPAGPDNYFGRGAMQLSWNYNYKAAGDYLGVDLLNNPDLVTTDTSMLWRTALWFWMNPGQTSTPHAVFKQGFGATIQLINGPMECGGGRPDAVSGRLTNYTNALGVMGVEAGGTDNGC